MISLLGALRREMNGAVADAMHYYGKRYGLNYGVSLPTIRTIAAEQPTNNSLALYLYKQDVRELRLAALYIADRSMFEQDEATWREGISTSEIAEEMAFALLCKVESLPDIFHRWVASEQEFVVYAALMAAARAHQAMQGESLELVIDIVTRHSSSRIVAQGVVALLAAAVINNRTSEVKAVIERLPDVQIKDYIADEISWRME
jgi:3-methyladenine DNA glycosylase AlkD